jgi:hypothetical protein
MVVLRTWLRQIRHRLIGADSALGVSAIAHRRQALTLRSRAWAPAGCSSEKTTGAGPVSRNRVGGNEP